MASCFSSLRDLDRNSFSFRINSVSRAETLSDKGEVLWGPEGDGQPIASPRSCIAVRCAGAFACLNCRGGSACLLIFVMRLFDFRVMRWCGRVVCA